MASLLGGGWAARGFFTVSTHNRTPICQIISQCGRTKVFICLNFIHHCLNTSSLYCDGSWELQLRDRDGDTESSAEKRLNWKEIYWDLCRCYEDSVDKHLYVNLKQTSTWTCESCEDARTKLVKAEKNMSLIVKRGSPDDGECLAQTWPISAVFFGPRWALTDSVAAWTQPHFNQTPKSWFALGRLGHVWSSTTVAVCQSYFVKSGPHLAHTMHAETQVWPSSWTRDPHGKCCNWARSAKTGPD